MNKPSITGRLARWLLLLQEFDITIIDNLGRANVVVDCLSRSHHDDNDTTLVHDAFLDEHLFHIVVQNPWYADIANYIIANKIVGHFSYKEKKFLVEKILHFSWINNLLFYTRPDQIMRRCVREDETCGILHACHNEPSGGHFVEKRTTLKILTTSYYWPTCHKDAANYTQKCDKCQRMG